LATVFVFLGIALLTLAKLAPNQPGLDWLAIFPVSEIGGALFTTGLLAVAFEYFDAKDSETRATTRLRRILAEQAPTMRDAVIDGFAFKSDDLKRVSSPEVLDRITRNSLAIQLGDQDFAEEVYDDLKQQVITAGERREDLSVHITLSPWVPSRQTSEPLFVATARWEYTVVPTSPLRRFTSVSDLQEYRELIQEPGTTSVWHFRPVNGLDGGSSEAFELVQFSIDGTPRPIRRSERKGGQTYTVSLGNQLIEAQRPTKIAYVYRTLVRQNGHYLHLRLGQPTKGLRISLRYDDCGIETVNVLDFMASSQRTTLTTSPSSVPEQSVAIDFAGWAFPQSGVTFVWTLAGETAGNKPGRPTRLTAK
jgi:hypothetical protein